MNIYNTIIDLVDLYHYAAVDDKNKRQPWNFSFQYYKFHYIPDQRKLKIAAYVDPVGFIEAGKLQVYNVEIFEALIGFIRLFQSNLNFIKSEIERKKARV